MSYRVPALFIEKKSHSGHNDEMNFKVELRVPVVRNNMSKRVK